jgi:hypothetical protein
MKTPTEQNAVNMGGAVFNALSQPAYQREATWLREEIAGAKDDVKGIEARAAEIRLALPKLETELLICERDAAQMKLEIIEKRALLAQKEGQR